MDITAEGQDHDHSDGSGGRCFNDFLALGLGNLSPTIILFKHDDRLQCEYLRDSLTIINPSSCFSN